MNDIKIKTKHSLGYCNLCETKMIICASCGNNCCNGGSGMINGKNCLDCLDAYEIQDKYRIDNNSIEFENKDLIFLDGKGNFR